MGKEDKKSKKEEVETKKAESKKEKKVESDSDSDSDEEEAKKATTPVAKKAAAKKEDSDSDEEEKPKKKEEKKAAKKEESDSDDEEEEKPKKKEEKKPAKKEESDSDEEEKPKKEDKKRKADDESEETEESQAVPKKAKTEESSETKAEGTTVFVGGLSYDAGEEDVKEFFKDCGTINSVRIPMNEMNKPRGMAFVEFSSAEEAQKACELNGQEMMNRYLKISISTRSAPGEGQKREFKMSEKPEGCKTIFVGNLSWGATEDDLKATFAECGTVSSARIAMGEDGRSRGFGHVEFEEEDAVDKAVKLSGTEIAGRAIRVDYAGNHDGGKREGGFGGRGGRGGRGRGGFRGGRGGFGDRGGRGGRGGFGGRGGRGGFGGRGGRGGRGGFSTNKPSLSSFSGKAVSLDDD